jgi:DNA-binding XRE family transcriptional regulator
MVFPLKGRAMIINNIAYWRSTMNRGKGVSQAHLARKVGVGRSFVTKLEKGRTQPGAELMFRVARYLLQPVESVFRLVEGTKTRPVPVRSDMMPNRNVYATVKTGRSTNFPSVHGNGREPINTPELAKRKAAR